MTDDPWLTAGAFARRSRLSPKALRLYASNGLLVPRRIDKATGYRHYHEDQLRDARFIKVLRRAAVPLAVVARILHAPRVQRAALIDDHLQELERFFRYRRQLLKHLALTVGGGKENYPMLNTKIRDVEEQIFVTEQAYVNAAQLPQWIVQAGLRQIENANKLGGQRGPSQVIYHGEVNEDNDGPVEMAIPVSPQAAAQSAIATRTEPAHRQAYVTITRAQVRYPDILSAYDAVERFINDQDHTIIGPAREVYFNDPSSGEPDELVADVAFPIAP